MTTTKLVFKAIVGSRLYGVNIKDSDLDYIGMYIQPNSDILGTKYKEQININKDETHFEIRRFLELLAKGSPRHFESLWVPEECILVKSKIYDFLRSQRQLFWTKQCYKAFTGMTFSNIREDRDTKGWYHAARTCLFGEELLKSNNLTLPVSAVHRQYLLDIRQGHISTEEVKIFINLRLSQADIGPRVNNLPDKISDDVLHKLVLECRQLDE